MTQVEINHKLEYLKKKVEGVTTKSDVLYTDGYANPYYCGFMVADSTSKVLYDKKFPPAMFTNNDCEYLGCLYACMIAINGATIYTDSALVEGHINKNWKRNAKFDSFYVCLKELIRVKSLNLKYINREENIAGVLCEFQYKNFKRNKNRGSHG